MNDSSSGVGPDGFGPADHLGGILPSTPPIADNPQFPATYKRKLGDANSESQNDSQSGGDGVGEDHVPTHYEQLHESGKLRWLVIGGVVAILAIAGLLALSVGTSSDALQTARDFMGHLDNGEYAEALELTDPACTGGADEAGLAGIFQGADIDFELTRSEVNATGGSLVDGTLTVGGVQRPLTLTMRKVDGAWKVCDLG